MAGSTFSFPALGTAAVVAVAVTERTALEAAVAAARQEVAACDAACSRFRTDSELSRLNTAGGQLVPVSRRLIDDLEAAVRAARLTDGIVDPTVGQALVNLGYDRDFDAIDPRQGSAMVTFTPVPGWTTIYTDRSAGRARVPAGVLLDLGSTAKARCADLAADAAARAAGCGVLVSLGGDIAFAGSPPPGGWTIRVTDDARAAASAPGQMLSMEAGGLATSGTTVRSWRRGGSNVHHLIDPRTGGPAPVVWRTVSVAAATCLDANIGATAAVILGRAAPGWLDELGLTARLVHRDGAITRVGGWPPETAPAAAAGNAA